MIGEETQETAQLNNTTATGPPPRKSQSAPRCWNLGFLLWRERYRLLVSLLIIPLGIIIFVRGMMAGVQAWMLVVLGLTFITLEVVQLRAYTQTCGYRWGRKR